MLARKMAEKLARDMLDRDGIRAVWDFHLAAISATEAGKHEMAASLLEVTEAAERLWAAREKAPVRDPHNLAEDRRFCTNLRTDRGPGPAPS